MFPKKWFLFRNARKRSGTFFPVPERSTQFYHGINQWVLPLWRQFGDIFQKAMV
jgi:hypothetical protein